jgi:hypothetical protein
MEMAIRRDVLRRAIALATIHQKSNDISISEDQVMNKL